MAVLARQQTQFARGILVPAGGPILGQEYFGIKDQSGQLWTWWIDETLTPNWGLNPESPSDEEVTLSPMRVLIPSWIKIRDANLDAWYVYPEVDGSPLVEATEPPIGEGITEAPALRIKGRMVHYRLTVVGGALDVVSV